MAGEALDLADDITKEAIAGPGGIQINTGKDILMSFGATMRFIPTSESSWDFGLSKNAGGFLTFSPATALGNNFFKDHFNEAGYVNNDYARVETKLHINALPKDRRWSFYAALEYDGSVDTNNVDNRGGPTRDTSNFGLERLNASMLLGDTLRLHAGWDVWHLDAFEGGGLVYGDDNPGIWIDGKTAHMDFSFGVFKLEENDFKTGVKQLNDDNNDDRTLFAGYVDWTPDETNRVKAFYAYDQIRSVQAGDMIAGLTNGALGIQGDTPETDSHHVGALYVGTWGAVTLFAEGVYQFGTAENTGLAIDDYDIAAHAFAADLSCELKGVLTGFPFKPHVGFVYTSGDGDGNDDTLGGYNGVINAQRYSKHWGGENTIVGDTNLVFGSLLYGYVPELYGNGTPVFTGGLPNAAGYGGGRGDNPGLSMLSAGFTLAPRKFLIFKTNVNAFAWNEDFSVSNYVTSNPVGGTRYSTVEAGYVGSEWDNELTFALSKHSVIRGQVAVFFPGEGIRDVTRALGAESDETASRVAVELIWNF